MLRLHYESSIFSIWMLVENLGSDIYRFKNRETVIEFINQNFKCNN